MTSRVNMLHATHCPIWPQDHGVNLAWNCTPRLHIPWASALLDLPRIYSDIAMTNPGISDTRKWVEDPRPELLEWKEKNVFFFLFL